MRILFCEWKKLLSFRVFWIMLVCLLLVNGYMQVDRTKDRYYTPESYRLFFAETEEMSHAEIQDYLNDLMQKQSEGEYTVYPMYLIYDMLELSKECQDYPEYLESIEKQAENMTSVSIWGGKDTFSYRNIQKTPSAYANITVQELPLAPSFGLENTFTSPITDYMGIFLIFLIVCAVMLKDRERGMMPLLYAMPNGRQQLFLKKFAVTAICTCGVAMLLFGENLLIGGYLYGLGDLSRPIQSVFGLYSCNLPVSVGEYLVLFFLMKMASYLLFAAVFSLVCISVKNNLMIYGVCGAFCGISFLLYHFISEVSVLSLFHFLNPVQITQVNEVLGTYKNINLFGFPFSLKASVLVLFAFILILAVSMAMLISAKSRNVQYRTISLRLFHQKSLRVHSRFFYVCYRTLVLQRGIVLVFAAVFAAGIMSASFSRPYSNDDIYYENFTTQYQGEITQETLDFIADKEAYYEQIEQRIAKLQMQENINTYKVNQLSNELNDRYALERMKERIIAIQGSEKDGQLFYDTGYERLFGIDGNNEDMLMILMMMLFLVFLLSPFAASDKKTGMIKILFSSKCGKFGYYKDLILYSVLCGAFVSILFTLPYIWNILNSYGMQGLSSPIQSIKAFSGVNHSFTVSGMILLLLIVRTVSAAITAVLISIISSICSSTMTAYIANLGLFALPVILVLLGVKTFAYVGMIPFLSFNQLFK